MKKTSKKLLKWGLVVLGFVLAWGTYSLYRMFAVVYGPPPVIHDPPLFEITSNDSLKGDIINEIEPKSKESLQ